MNPSPQRTLHLTEGDIEVFWYLRMLGVLTLDQVRRLRYFHPRQDHEKRGERNEEKDRSVHTHPDNVRKRLARLKTAGYILGDDIWDEETRKRIRIYRLGKEALPHLQQKYGIDQTRLYSPREQTTFRQVSHSLLMSECADRITESIRGSSFLLPHLGNLSLPFILTHTIEKISAKKHTHRYFSQEDIIDLNTHNTHRIRPDLVFALGKEGTYRLFFLEADRGTENPKILAEKLEGYHAYATAHDPHHPHKKLWERYDEGCRDFRVLIVTTTERRLALLRKRLSGVKGYELTAFSSLSPIGSQDMVFGEVWYVGDLMRRELLRKS